MNSTDDENHRTLLAHVLFPVVTEKDARLHVIEKGGGVPDKTPVEQFEELAADAFAAVREELPNATEQTAYSQNVVKAIFDAAEVGASAIAYRSRGGGRLMRFLSSDLSLQLVTQVEYPVIALPRRDAEA